MTINNLRDTNCILVDYSGVGICWVTVNKTAWLGNYIQILHYSLSVKHEPGDPLCLAPWHAIPRLYNMR